MPGGAAFVTLGDGNAAGGRVGGKRTTGLPFSVVITVCLDRTEPAGECTPSRDAARPRDDLRLIDMP